MSWMEEFENLSPKEKVWIIGGTAAVIVVMIAVFVFAEFFVVQDRLGLRDAVKAGLSLFHLGRSLLPVMCALVFVPGILSFSATALLMGYPISIRDIAAAFILCAVGLLTIAGVLTLFDLLLSALPLEWQIPLLSASFIPALKAVMMTDKTIHSHRQKPQLHR